MIAVDDLPASIRVGPYTIKITIEDVPNAYGQFSPADQEITIQPAFKTAPLAIDTVLHELLHAMWFATALPKKYEERFVSALSPCLTQVLQDNPGLRSWLLKSIP